MRRRAKIGQETRAIVVSLVLANGTLVEVGNWRFTSGRFESHRLLFRIWCGPGNAGLAVTSMRSFGTRLGSDTYVRDMLRRLFLLILLVGIGISTAASHGQVPQPDAAIVVVLRNHQYDLKQDGRNFFLDEARRSDFFLLGELHGENEIPALLAAIWPQMWEEGYRHIAAEVSPWAAYQLERVPQGKGPLVQGLWQKMQAENVHSLADTKANVLWGCDMEEEQPQFLIRELSARNPDDANLKRMVVLTNDGYSRKMAPDLLDILRESKSSRDEVLNDVSLRRNLLASLEIEKNRLNPDTKMIAQDERELLMKEQFLTHFHHGLTKATPSKVLFRFGRNHLHRGYDARGVSTLGNFIAEFAVARGAKVFNAGAFAAGGKEALLGNTFDADERQDELAFAMLAEQAKYAETVYDLRPIRQMLHQIPQEKRSALENNLVYWADSYDALICYKTVTPIKSGQ
jgi:hypothetical protein